MSRSTVFFEKTLYASPLMVITEGDYSKHYFIEGERVCSKIGGGFKYAPINPNDDHLAFLNGCAQEVSSQLMEAVILNTYCTGFDGTHDIKPYFDPPRNVHDDHYEPQYFYHSDHLGSSSFITDATGYAEQHIQYLPFGELFVSQRNTSFDSRYKFTAKELDNETNYTYFGARYYDSDISIWLSVDPLSDKYPRTSSYMYCLGRPIVLIDPDGRSADWYRNEAGEVAYNESIRHKVDFDKSGIEGTYLGKTHQEGSKYYSLFGEEKDLKTTEGKLYQKMDEAMINNAYFTNRMRKWNESGGYDETTMPTEARTNLDIGLKMKYDAFGLSETYSNIIEFSYNGAKGYYFNFENKESLIGTLDWNPGQGYSSNKHKGVGYPLDGGYNVFIRPSKGYRSDTYCVLLVFNSQSNKSNFYEKWRKEFLVK